MIRIPKTKLRPALVRSRFLARARLLDQLASDPDAPLTLVLGPAGSGKTTLLHDHPAAWVSLGEEDLDPEIFLFCILEALCLKFPGSAETTRNLVVQGADVVGQQKFLQTALVNELLEYGQPVRLVLDDFHIVAGAAVMLDWVGFLLRRGPANLHLVLSSRTCPDLPLARIRARGCLLMVDQLRFNDEEAVELFHQILQQPLEPRLISILVEKTAGWATGLQLAAQKLKGLDGPGCEEYINSLQGTEQHIYDYLVTEVFEAQPNHIQDFLLNTAIPDSFTLELAEVLSPHSPALAAIEHIQRDRLFLACVEPGGGYRYDDFFREFLLRRGQRRPSCRELHGLAGDWLKTNGEVARALPHYLAARNMGEVVGLVEQFGSTLLQQGFRSAVARWLQELPIGLRRTRPALLLLQAELCDLTGHREKAQRLFLEALRLYQKNEDARGQSQVLENLTLSLMKHGQSDKLIQICEDFLANGRTPEPGLRSLLLSWLGATYVYTGADWTRGYQLLEEGHQAAEESADARAIAWSALTYGFAYHFPRGNRNEALAVLDRGIEHCQHNEFWLIGYQLQMNRALVQLTFGDLTGASELVDEIMTEARRTGHHFVSKGLENLRAMIYLQTGATGRAMQILETISAAGVPAQMRPLYHSTSLLCRLESGFLQQAEEELLLMRGALTGCAQGLYAFQCNLAEARLHLAARRPTEARLVLEAGLDLCQQAEARFWEGKTRELLDPPGQALAVCVKQPRLEIRTFGTLELLYAGEAVNLSREVSRRGLQLLKLLLCAVGRTTPVDLILDTFWPGMDPTRGKNNLSAHLAPLRSLLRVEHALPRKGDGYRLNFGATLGADVHDFLQLVKLGRNCQKLGQAAEARHKFEQAESLHAAPFLQDDLYDDWIVERRRSLEEDFLRITELLADDHYSSGRIEEAADRYRKLLGCEHPSESVFLKLFRCHNASGDRLGARRDLEVYRSRLFESTGLEPRVETVAMVQAFK